MPATPVWTRLPEVPEARHFHAAAYDPVSNRMVEFRGLGEAAIEGAGDARNECSAAPRSFARPGFI